MAATDPKDVLVRYLNAAHDALRWKMDGLSEYDLRRPLTSTGTNMLGVLKHLSLVELGYFGDVFGRPHGLSLEAMMGDEPNADMFASAVETSDQIFEQFERARLHAVGTIEALDLDAEGHVPWWGEAGNPVTVQLIAVHVVTEINRHLGQVDILREGLDGVIGMREGGLNLDPAFDWAGYSDRVEQIARDVGGTPS